jgi:hypothetical protein
LIHLTSYPEIRLAMRHAPPHQARRDILPSLPTPQSVRLTPTFFDLMPSRNDGAFVQFTGSVDGGAIERRQWRAQSNPRQQGASPLSAAGSQLLVSTIEYDSSLFATLGAWAYWLRPFTTTTSFEIIDDAHASPAFRSELHVQCEPPAFTDEGPVCSAHDGSRFHLGVFDPGGATVTPLAKFERVMTFQVAPGWITGWWNTPFALDRATGQLVLIEQRTGGRPPYMMTASEEAVGVVRLDPDSEGRTVLEIYPRRAIIDH